jgi:glycerol-3-phosphate cytidylyltransferase
MKVLTVGTFDLLHSGHIKLFENCKKLAGGTGKVVVGVNTDEFVFKYKNFYPVIPFQDRVEVISNLREVDMVVPNDKENLEKLLLEVHPNILLVGSDWAKKDYFNQIGVSIDWLYKHDILLLYSEYTKDISSTLLRNKLNK